MFRILSLVAIVIGLQGCWNDHSWNQKITIVVETPGGIKTGSAITRVEQESNFFIYTFFKDGSPKKYIRNVYGEAAFIYLGDEKYIFMLINDGDFAYLATDLVKLNKALADVNVLDGVNRLPKPTIVPTELYPQLVFFEDVNNPQSVRQIPKEYTVKEILFEITDEPVTENVITNIMQCLKMKKLCAKISKNAELYQTIKQIQNGSFARKQP